MEVYLACRDPHTLKELIGVYSTDIGAIMAVVEEMGIDFENAEDCITAVVLDKPIIDQISTIYLSK